MNVRQGIRRRPPEHPHPITGRGTLNIPASIHFRVLVAAALFALAAAPAIAGRYEIVKGKGVKVCEAYERNLNSFKPRSPFRCDRPVSPDLKDFSKPVFKGSYDLIVPGAGTRSYPVVKKVERFLWERDANPVYNFRDGMSKWRGTPEQYEQTWRHFLSQRERQYMDRWKIAEIDIDNDGTPDTVYRDGQCPTGTLLLVVNKDMTDIDRARTQLVMPHPSRKTQGLGEYRKLTPGERAAAPERGGYTEVEDALHGASYDVFQYKNKTYFDLWWIQHPDYQGKLDFQVGKPLRVLAIENNRTREICTYKYID